MTCRRNRGVVLYPRAVRDRLGRDMLLHHGAKRVNSREWCRPRRRLGMICLLLEKEVRHPTHQKRGDRVTWSFCSLSDRRRVWIGFLILLSIFACFVQWTFGSRLVLRIKCFHDELEYHDVHSLNPLLLMVKCEVEIVTTCQRKIR
jgi:hypothetical protein